MLMRSADGITWDTVIQGTRFHQRLRHAMVVFNDRMYVIGGVSGEDL